MTIADDMAASLDEALDAAYDPAADSRFRVDDASKAEWALGKMARAVRAQEAAAALAAERKAMIDEWAADEVRRHEGARSFFESLLIGYIAERNAADGTKTINLPGGALKARRCLPKVEVDAAAFVAWATETGRADLLHTKVGPDKAAIKTATLDDGEALPHVAVDPGGEITYSVTLADPSC